ncbi:MAG: hypothetical protein ACRDLF_08705, partial [Solirubrobacteraceae bacterium]
PRKPRPGPASGLGSPHVEPVAAAPAQRSSARGRRLFAALFALLLAAVVVVAVIVATAPTPTKISLRNVVYSDVERTSAALQELVRENTK